MESRVDRDICESALPDSQDRALRVSEDFDEVADLLQVERGKTALISGITGQDGSYLSEFLLSRGYHVHGIIRRSSSFNTGRINHIYQDQHEENVRLHLHFGDVTDTARLVQIISAVKPDEIYHLAAQSHVKVSFDMAEYTGSVTALGTMRMLEAIRICSMEKSVRLYNLMEQLIIRGQAATSELYGKVEDTSGKQNEDTPFRPRSPYAIAKHYSYSCITCYREAYGMYLCNGILFNHESPRRGPTFVTRKITRAVARIAQGMQECLYLGNLNAKRDWGHAREYVVAMWMMLQQPEPSDYVIASGEAHSVREFAELAFEHARMPIRWEGSCEEEVGVVVGSGQVVIRIDPRYYRPVEVPYLCGDSTRAREMLKWQPRVSFEALVREMVDSDIARLKAGDVHS